MGTPGMPRRRLDRAARGRIAASVAADHDGVANRAELRARGVTRADVRTEITAGRWVSAGRHTVLIVSGELSSGAQRWRAVWETGSGAALDGVAALLAAGLTGFAEKRIDVSLPHNNLARPVDGVRAHKRRRMPALVGAGIPRIKPQVAALHAASWGVSDRQAVLILCLVVQQRLVHPAHLVAALDDVRLGRRRQLIRLCVADICDGAHSLGELDFAGFCREAGLPEPTRQVVRTGPNGRIYLDVAWEDIGLVVEIDGGHHATSLGPIDDALRQNSVTLGGSTVLVVPVLGLRLMRAAFMEQIVAAHTALTARRAA